MARKVKQNKNNNNIIESSLQAALKMAGLVPANETTSVTDVVEKTKPVIEVAEVSETKWGSYMGVPVPEEAIPAIQEIHKDFLKEMDAAVTTASTVTPTAAFQAQEAVLPTPVSSSTTTAEWVIKAAAGLRFKTMKAQQPMSFRDIFKSREQRASEDALLLAQAEEEIRAELAAR